MKKKIGLFMLCGIMLLGLCGCGNSNDIDTTNEDTSITLSGYEKKIYDFILSNDFYNKQEVRVETGNILYGFKINGFNKVGGSISQCYDFFARYDDYKTNPDSSEIRETDDCAGSLYDRFNEGEYYIDIKAINQALKQHWEDMGY